MSELALMLSEVAARMQALEAENAQLKAQLAAHATVWPHVEALYEALAGTRVKAADPAPPPPRVKSPTTRYSADDVAKWYTDLRGGDSVKTVSQRYDVDPATIRARTKAVGYMCSLCGTVITPDSEGWGQGPVTCGLCQGEEKGAKP